jgi:hypothetical protein
VDECIGIFKQRLDEFATKGQFIDLGHWLQCYAFDVIGKITVRILLCISPSIGCNLTN